VSGGLGPDDRLGRVRFCGQCNLNVYNLSGMTRDEAESLIARNEGRLCVRFYKRRDGSIITQDCPVGLRAVHARASYWLKAVAAAVLAFLATIGFQSLLSTFHPFELRMTTGKMIAPVDEVILEQGGMGAPSSGDVVLGRFVETRHDRRKKRR
jgi:hypothetical protein